MMDRREFVAAAAAALGAPLVTAAGQGTARTSPGSSPPLPPDNGLFTGFDARWVRTRGADIFLRHGGEGPPLLLLHGNPMTHASWHKIAGPLSRRFHIVAADLRGYGDSVGPAGGGPNHINYSFRAMAQDQVDVMAALGFDRFFVAGHDRGARAAHRLALDHPARVRKVALLDIVPTRHVWAHPSREWTLASWHWSFMAQPEDMFERMIAAIPAREFVVRHLGRTGPPAFFDERALNEYVRCFTQKTIHGSCEDYRAAATIDLEHDNADQTAGRKISEPALVMWGRRSGVGRFYGGDILPIWREAATDVTGGPLETGHYLAEEDPRAVIAAFERFFV
jgi:haloacetate dehalogenase